MDIPTLKEMAEFYNVQLPKEIIESWVPISPAEAQNRLMSYRLNNGTDSFKKFREEQRAEEIQEN